MGAAVPEVVRLDGARAVGSAARRGLRLRGFFVLVGWWCNRGGEVGRR